MITSQYPVFTLPEAAEHKKKSEKYSSRTKAYFALALGIFFVSWTAILVNWSGVPATTSAFYRSLIASAILIPAWVLRSLLRKERPVKLLREIDKRVIGLAVLAGAMFAADMALYNTAILMTSAANATLLGNNAAIMVAIASWIFLKKKPANVFWAGLAIASVGSVIIIGKDLMANPHFGYGDIYALLSAVAYAGYLIMVGQTRESVDTLTLVTITVASSAATLLIITLAMGAPLGNFSATTWAALIALGVFSQVGGYIAITYALGHLPATLTSICLLMQVPFTALLAVPLLGEGISMEQAIGGLFVLTGVYVVSAYSDRQSKPLTDAISLDTVSRVPAAPQADAVEPIVAADGGAHYV